MPRKKQKDGINMPLIIEEVISQFRSILEEHMEHAGDFLARSETGEIGWSLHASIDVSESSPIVTTRDKIGEVYTTKRTSQLDVDQEKFTPILDAAKGSKKKGTTATVDMED